jgi:PTS system nitrogen regulatory IIA component
MNVEWIAPSLKATDKPAVLLEFANIVGSARNDLDISEIYTKLMERELKASTGADHGVAIPHATLNETQELMVAFGKSDAGVPFAALDNADSHLFFVVLAPAKAQPNQASYLQLISSICRLMRSQSLRDRLMQAPTAAAILDLLKKEEDLKLAAPPTSSIS